MCRAGVSHPLRWVQAGEVMAQAGEVVAQAGAGMAQAGLGMAQAGVGMAPGAATQTFLDGAGQRFCSSPNTAALCSSGDRQQPARPPRSLAAAQRGSFSSFVCSR